MDTEVHHRLHKTPPSVILIQINSVYTLRSNFLNELSSYNLHYLQLSLQSDLFPSDFPTKMVSTLLFFFLCGLFYDTLSRMTGE